MLKKLLKLIKYDLLADYKKYAALYAAMLGSSVMMLFFSKMTSWVHNNLFIKAMSIVFTSLFFILVVAAAVMFMVFSTTRFYKNIVRDEGYLMHTLPVPTWQLLASKLISVYIWYAATIIISGICSGIAFGEPLWLFKFFGEFGEAMSEVRSSIGEENTKVLLSMMRYAVVLFVLTPFFAMSNIYFSFALGNLFNKYKLGMSVLMYFAIKVAEQIIGSVTSMVVSTDMFSVMVNTPDVNVPEADILNYVSATMNVSIIISLALSIGYMIAAERIFSKKLNLE